MQFLVSKQELERGGQLRLSFSTDEMEIEEAYSEQTRLNEQGYFTVMNDLNCDDGEEQKFKIDVYQRNEPLVQIG